MDRLRATTAWSTASVTSRATDPVSVLRGIEEAISGLPEYASDFQELLAPLSDHPAWPSLLKAGRDAVTEALAVEDSTAPPLTTAEGHLVPDPRLKGVETVPLGGDIDEHMAEQVHPYAPDAWPEKIKVKVGYEIPFTEVFYTYEPPPPLEELDADLKRIEADILALLAEVTE